MARTDHGKLALTHMRLLVTDYPACFRFYRDVLGFEPTWGDVDGVYADFDTGETTLALFDRESMAESVGRADAPRGADQQDTVAVIFEVASVDATYEALREEAEFVTEPHDRPGWGIRVAHFRDPSGTLLEINEPLAED